MYFYGTSIESVVIGYNMWLTNHPDSKPIFVSNIERGYAESYMLLVTFETDNEGDIPKY
jgi:hypothetical protein